MRLRTIAGMVIAGVLWSGGAEIAQAQESILRIREKCLEFYQAIGSKQIDTYVKGRESDFDRVYKNYHYLVTAPKIEEVRSFIPGTGSDEERNAYELLEKFLIGETIHKASAPEIDGGNNYLTSTEIVVSGEEISLRDVIHRMGEQPDRSMRRQWMFAYKEFLENANVFLLQAVHLSNEAATEFGYTDYLDFLSEYKNFDLAKYQTASQTLVDGTNDVYRTLLHEQIEATFGGELTPEEIRFYDMPVVWRMSRFDEGLPEKKAFATMKNVFKGVGLSIDDKQGGKISELRATVDYARSGVSGYLDQPTRNMMTLGYKPGGGFVTYSDMLMEVGRLVYYGRAGGMYYENHFFGDPSMAYAIGYLFQSLMENPSWLAEFTKLEGADLEGAVRAHVFRRAFTAREFAGRALFLPIVYEGQEKQPREVFETVFEPIRMWSHTEVDRVMYMFSNGEFDSIARLRGMILAVGLRNMLEGKFGETWYKEKKAGEMLSALWTRGQQQSVYDFATSIDMPDIDPNVLVNDLQAAVGMTNSSGQSMGATESTLTETDPKGE